MDRPLHFHSLLQLLLLAILMRSSRAAELPPQTELLVGFKAKPDPSVSSFQPLLKDSSGNYSLGFLRVDADHLTLSVIHLPSEVPLWHAATTRLPRWADPTQVFFTGSLVLSDPHTGVSWSTQTSGDRVWLSNTSNLVVHKLEEDCTILWQSFDFPTDTLVENQNFTTTMALVSSNGFYSMRLGPDYIGLYAKFGGRGPGPGQIYLRHGALQVKANIVKGLPIRLALQSDGYLGMFQNGSLPVDVQPFNTFQQNLNGIRRLRLEPDGDLKGYYWTGSNWVLDYQIISDACELPSPCGSYSLCLPVPGKGCSCLNNRTEPGPGGCEAPDTVISGDFCGAYASHFHVLRRTGVDLPFKELMGYEKMASMDSCEAACAANCTCWGVVYSNSSGFCYRVDYPIQTLVAVEDKTKLGYFKVRVGVRVRDKKVAACLGWVLGLGLGIGAVLIGLGIWGVKVYKARRSGVNGYIEEEGMRVGPYKDLGAASFRSIELSGK